MKGTTMTVDMDDDDDDEVVEDHDCDGGRCRR
jgi:hypothetical protein